eukprot:c29554_g1_i1.p1 GENE.c29554_g1_i1~~c29554_g1_i1.p1  ORF type:complete len:316 (+),score=10.77 c29554_g1_i1:126-1073(+)
MLNRVKGSHTSMITLAVTPDKQIHQVNKSLEEELSKCSRIKSTNNRHSVEWALSSIINTLKAYKNVPVNGLVFFVGTIIDEDINSNNNSAGGKEKTLNIHFSPYRPVEHQLYLCDKSFHTEMLEKMLVAGQSEFGFIVVDGNGCLFAVVSGGKKKVLHKFSVELPKKHGRGGQSALRFSRLRDEKRHNYVRKVAEMATNLFITDHKCNVDSIILAGSADFKNVLAASDLFDPRLSAKVIKVVDIAYGMMNGLNQAVSLAGEAIGESAFLQEKQLLGNFFKELAIESGMVVYGPKHTLRAFREGRQKVLCQKQNKC